jgi:hypothetical protein
MLDIEDKNKKNKQINISKNQKISRNNLFSALEKEKEKESRKKIRRKSKINIFLNKYFQFVVIFIVIIILILSFVYILKPKYYKSIEAIQGNWSAQKKIYIEQSNRLNDYKKIVEIYKTISPGQKSRLDDVLPAKYLKEKLFIELGYILPRNGYQLNDLTMVSDYEEEKEDIFTKSRPNSKDEIEFNELSFLQVLPADVGYIKVDLDIGLINYRDFKRLLNILENNIKLIDIYNVSFNPEAESSSISFVTYYFK